MGNGCWRSGPGPATTPPCCVTVWVTRVCSRSTSNPILSQPSALDWPDWATARRCSVPAVPWAWVEQTRPGGVILTDIKVGLVAGNLVRLTRVAADRAEGMFDAGQAAFMELRHNPGAGPRTAYAHAADDTPILESVTALDPRTPWSNPVVWFLAASRVGGHYRLGYTGGDSRDAPEAVSMTTPDGSHAEIALAGDDDGHRVVETGPVRLWQQVEQAHHQWESAGRPGWPRLGLVVTPTAQTIYVDEPGNGLISLH